MFPFVRYVHLFSPSLQWVPWPLLSEALRFPTFTGTYGFVRLLIHPWTDAYRLPWRPGCRSRKRRRRALLGSWGIHLETCLELETPAISVRPSQFRSSPSAAFRRDDSVGIATRDFGAESSRPASLLCTLRTHQLPGEWQHSLPACSLALAGQDFHPLDSVERFHQLKFGSPSPKLFPARHLFPFPSRPAPS
jgi:hypothetical protein